jgi:HTH-type transcriptional regulator/antitoxin HigA
MSTRITPIKTQRDHDRALKEIEGLMDARRGTRRGERLDALVAAVEAREARRFAIDLPDAV